MNPHCLPNAIKVPVVSKNVTNTSENNIIIKFGIFENNCPNPLTNPANKDVSKLAETNSDGIAGIKISPAPNPHKVNITPMMAVTTNPINTAAGTLFTYKIKVMIILMERRILKG